MADILNSLEFQIIIDLSIPIFTMRLIFPVWYTLRTPVIMTCGFASVDSYGVECDLEHWSHTKKQALCEYLCQFDDYPMKPDIYWEPERYSEDYELTPSDLTDEIVDNVAKDGDLSEACMVDYFKTHKMGPRFGYFLQ